MNDSKYLEEVIRYERKITDLQMEAAATALKLQASNDPTEVKAMGEFK